MARAAAGDRASFAALYDRFAPGMRLLGAKMLRDPDAAADVVHDVFIEAWLAAGSYRPERGTVGAWLRTRMRSRCLDHLKSSAVRRRAHVPIDLDDLADRSDRCLDPAELAEAARAVLALPDKPRGAVVLVWFAGMTGPEAALRLGVPVETLKSRLAAGMATLRGRWRPPVTGGVRR